MHYIKTHLSRRDDMLLSSELQAKIENFAGQKTFRYERCPFYSAQNMVSLIAAHSSLILMYFCYTQTFCSSYFTRC